MSTGGQIEAVPEPAGESTQGERPPAAIWTEIRTPQEICRAYRSVFVPPATQDKVAVAINTLGQPPLNARRISPERNNCGWYIWGGESGGRSQPPGGFQTMTVAHLIDHCPRIIPFLALGPGWRVRIAANGPEITPPHDVPPPANVAARRIGATTSPPPSAKQWVWLSILLHILAVVLFGDTTGGGARRGERNGPLSGGPMTVTLQGPADRGVDAPLQRMVNTPGPRRREAADSVIRAARPPKNTAPAAIDSPPPATAATPDGMSDAMVMPPLIATEVDKPVTDFVVPITVPVAIPDPPEPPTAPPPPEPEAPSAHLPPSLPRLNAITPPKATNPPTIGRDVALPTELIPRLTPLAPARSERESQVPVESPRLKTFVPPRIEPEVVAPPIQMPRMLPLTPLATSQVEHESVRPAELLPRLPPVLPAAATESVAPAAQVPRIAQPVAPDSIPEPARLAPPAIVPSAPMPPSSPPLAPSVSRVIPGLPDGVGTAQDRPAAAVPTQPSATGNAPRIDLDAVRQRARELAREGSGPRTLLPFNVKPREEIRKKEQQAFDKALKRPDCRDAYSDMGLAAVVPLLWDSVSEKGCKW